MMGRVPWRLDERLAGEVCLEEPENSMANRPLRGERRRGRWTLGAHSGRPGHPTWPPQALRPREGTISPVDPSPTDLRRSHDMTSAQRAANGDAPAAT